jgi:hypothetical protein
MPTTVLQGSYHVAGGLSSDTFTPPAGSITNAAIPANAGITGDKTIRRVSANYSQAIGSVTAADGRVVHVAKAAGTILDFRAGSISLCTVDAVIHVDLKKNGTTVLTATIDLTSANTAYVAASATLAATPTYVAGDVFTVVVTVAAGAGALGNGVFAEARFDEAPQ